MISLVLVSTWMNMGGATLIYLAALQSIPGELYEAAELDGAGIWQRLRHVTSRRCGSSCWCCCCCRSSRRCRSSSSRYLLTGTSNPDTITVMVLIYRYALPSTTTSAWPPR